MAQILDTTDTSYLKSVRGLLGGVDDITLPDDDINDPSILDMAEFDVMDLLPSYASVTDPAGQSKLRMAVIHMMAVRLCPTMPARVEIEVKTIDNSFKKKPVDYSELADKLFATAVSLLSTLGVLSAGSATKVFAIAPSKRAVEEKYEQ